MQTIPGWSPFSVVDDRQSRTIYSVLAPVSEGDFHFLVEWDEDRDPRVLGAVLALYYRRPDLFEHVVVWSERKAWLTVQVLQRTVMLSENPRPDMSSVENEVKHALQQIVSQDTYAIHHDAWEVEVENISWPPRSDDALGGIHRLYKLGPQRPASVPMEIRVAESAGVTVTYVTEGKASRTAGMPGQAFQQSFGTLDEATAARLPEKAALARIPVVGGHLMRQRGAPWTFHKQD